MYPTQVLGIITWKYSVVVQDLSLLVDNGTDGVRGGFVMHGCPEPDSFSALFGRTLYMRFMVYLLGT